MSALSDATLVAVRGLHTVVRARDASELLVGHGEGHPGPHRLVGVELDCQRVVQLLQLLLGSVVIVQRNAVSPLETMLPRGAAYVVLDGDETVHACVLQQIRVRAAQAQAGAADARAHEHREEGRAEQEQQKGGREHCYARTAVRCQSAFLIYT